jgi:outer membrane protein assembly factor BamB
MIHRSQWHSSLRCAAIALATATCSDGGPTGGIRQAGRGQVVWHIRELRSPFSMARLGADSAHVYMYRSQTELSAVRLSDQRVVWTASANAAETGVDGLQGAARCGPTVVFGSYLAGYGVEPQSGRAMWRWRPSRGGGLIYGTLACDDAQAYFGTGQGMGVYGVDLQTGLERWAVDLGARANGIGFVFTPAVANGVVVACTREFSFPFNGVAVGIDTHTGRELWRQQWAPEAPIVHRGCGAPPAATSSSALIPVDDGRVLIFDLRTGAPRGTLPAIQGFLTPAEERPVAVLGQFAIAGSLSGVVIGFDPESGQERWRSTDAAATRRTTIIDGFVGDSGLFIGVNTSGWLLAFDAATGARPWTVQRGTALNERTFAPVGVLTRDHAIVVATDGLYAIRR